MQTFIDTTNPETRKYVWKLVKEHYYDLGIRNFWLDEAEPEIRPQQYHNLKMYAGNGAQAAMLLSVLLQPAFFMKGLKKRVKRTLYF